MDEDESDRTWQLVLSGHCTVGHFIKSSQWCSTPSLILLGFNDTRTRTNDENITINLSLIKSNCLGGGPPFKVFTSSIGLLRLS